jgi:hypothetical protein
MTDMSGTAREAITAARNMVFNLNVVFIMGFTLSGSSGAGTLTGHVVRTCAGLASHQFRVIVWQAIYLRQRDPFWT